MKTPKGLAVLAAALVAACAPKDDATVTWSGVNGKPQTFPVDPAAVQSRVTGACGDGTFVTGVNQDGSVACAADQVGAGDVTAVSAGAGLTGGGIAGDLALAVDPAVVQARVTGACGGGTFVTGVNQDGTVACDADANVTYTAGSGLALFGATFSTNDAVVARKDAAAGSQTFDGGTLHLDYASHRVGVGTTSPATRLEVAGTASADAFAYRTPRAGVLVVGATAFHTATPDPTVSITNVAYKTGGGSASLYAPVSLPIGATVTRMTCDVEDADATYDWSGYASLVRTLPLDWGHQNLLVVPLATTGSSYVQQRKEAQPTGTIVVDDAAWMVTLELPGSASTATMQLLNCRVEYTAPAPAY